jgi:protein-arginine kinase activator protein McsA
VSRNLLPADLEFERAAELRDRIQRLQEQELALREA